ncbi:translation initiation factor IF-2, partial [Patescibacteria group bacterium]|nr:translation initiation factor IF-2 [Patescibacteria group bacterium]
GKTIMVPISAKKKINIDQLLDMLLLVADFEKEHIVANPDRLAIGTVIESHIDKGQGPVATVLVQTGVLKQGAVLGLKGFNYGRVRAMLTWDGKQVSEAGPSTPVRILGFKDTPSVGDILEVPESPKNLQKLKAQPTRKSGAGDITVAHTMQKEGDEQGDDEKKIFLNLIIKADVLGSLEAIVGMIEKIDNPHVGVKIVHKGLGNVTDSEVLQAEASSAWILAFNVKPAGRAFQLARDKNVVINEYTVIYHLFEDIVDRLKILIPAETVYTELGTIEVLAVFKKLTKGMVVGGKVNKGKVEIGATARVLRAGEVIGEGSIYTLQAGKADVKEVQQGSECGIGFAGRTKIEVGDILEIYTEEKKERFLDIDTK